MAKKLTRVTGRKRQYQGEDRRARWEGEDRRAPPPLPPPPSIWPSVLGVILLLSGFGAWVLFHYLKIDAGEAVPMFTMAYGGYKIDKDALKELGGLLPWSKRSTRTDEHKARR